MDHRSDVIRALFGAARPDIALLPALICELCVQRLSLTAAGIALMSDGQSRGLLAATGLLAGRVEELQFSLGDGPCLEAFDSGAPALEPDLLGNGGRRWPGFAPAALAVGVRAVFAFPLQVGGARVGVLDLARATPGMLSRHAFADALLLAELATQAVLFLQSDADPGELGAALARADADHITVHQATGMVAVQLHRGVADALVTLQGYALANDRPLAEVADDVLARRLRFPG